MCTFRAFIGQKLLKNVMPSYLSIAWNIKFNRQSLEHEEKHYRGRMSVINNLHGNLPVLKDTALVSIV